MATTVIADEIEAITGVGTADASFLVSAQKFVVSSVPKSLLNFAQKASSASTDGSAITFSVNDSITDVQRNGYSCKEIPMSDAIWALDSTSLKYATAKHPVWYHKQGAVHFAPVTDGSNAGYVFYVDYTKIDDNSDLRNAVIFRAASSEFAKLASGMNSGITTALTYLKAAVDQAETAGDNFEVANTASVFGDTATFDATNSQITRVKDAVDKVQLLIETNKPASGYDAHDLLQAEDIELLNGNLSIVKSELERAQIHLAEWVAIGDMRVKQINSALAEAQGYANEVASRISQQQIYMAESQKYYTWAKEELQTYVGMNEKSIRYQSQQQQAQAEAQQ